jgi:hypothetical protein
LTWWKLKKRWPLVNTINAGDKTMKNMLASLLGFDWIQNFAAKKLCRAAAAAMVALAAKSKAAAVILAAFGLSGAGIEAGLVALSLSALEYIRIWAKGQTANPPPAA